MDKSLSQYVKEKTLQAEKIKAWVFLGSIKQISYVRGR